jgi:aminoglycoside phosphotransferase (APT) family kinase protein
MAVDVQALKTAPPDDNRAEQLIELCRSRLGGEWNLLSSSVKLSKAIFEAEYNGRLVIGKVSGSKRAQTAFASVTKLRKAGLQPPSEFTVPEPIAWFEDRKLLVLEKAPGDSVIDVLERGDDATEHVRRAADLLLRMHSSKADVAPDPFDVEAARKRATELAGAVSNPHLAPTASAAIDVLAERPDHLVLSHGDYHPMNIYVAPGRVTAIDMDTVALRPPEADVAYFIAQTANFGLMMFDRLDYTRELRKLFVARFNALDKRRMSAYIAAAFLQSLHYDACILKVENKKADLMVEAARSVLGTGSLDAAEA